MARQIRIQYENAIYHVMARGNRREPIFASPDWEDEALFIRTLGEMCGRTGIEVLAWVLMRNHYHLVIQTPRANLVDGMTWLQNTYTRRFNVRHRKWGRLFGDRYKSVLVEEGGVNDSTSSYLATLLDYVHLNPYRAGIIQSRKGKRILDYPGSSVAGGYALAPGKRPKWLKAQRGLQLFGFEDTVKQRRQFVERLDERGVSETAEYCGLAEIDGQSLNSTLRRGWFWGSEHFKESMLQRLDGIGDDEHRIPESAPYSGGSQAVDHRLRLAESIIIDGIKCFGLSESEDGSFPDLARGDIRRVAVAWAIWRRTSIPQKWIADRLELRSASNVSQRVRKFAATSQKDQSSKIREWRKMNDI